VKILIDMNLSPAWVAVFQRENWDALHWSKVGHPGATDREILNWAVETGHIVFTHDLDFGALLASSTLHRPSVIQLRGQETSPSAMGTAVVLAIKQLAAELEKGALVTIDPARARARILPL